jgi:hypothetical protein
MVEHGLDGKELIPDDQPDPDQRYEFESRLLIGENPSGSAAIERIWNTIGTRSDIQGLSKDPEADYSWGYLCGDLGAAKGEDKNVSLAKV